MTDTFFNIEMLPALHGDAIWIEYGSAGRKRRMLIDGGPISSYPALEKKLKTLPEGDKRVELLVITHVDTDHIDGIIRLLGIRHNKWLLEPRDIWFNGWKHLKGSAVLGGPQGDFLSALIDQRAPTKWNLQFKGKAVRVGIGKLLPLELNDGLEPGMKLTLLSPSVDKLEKMADVWAKDVEGKHLPGDLEKAIEQLYKEKKYHTEGVLGGEAETNQLLVDQLKIDQSVANGTSIAFLAEFGGKSCLFLGDAHTDVICESIKRLIPGKQTKLKVDAVKMAHHGSKSNISKELMELIDARYFLISTSGAIFQHPDKAAIKSVIQWSENEPTLYFNYRSPQNEIWEKAPSGRKKYATRYPCDGCEGILVEL